MEVEDGDSDHDYIDGSMMMSLMMMLILIIKIIL